MPKEITTEASVPLWSNQDLPDESLGESAGRVPAVQPLRVALVDDDRNDIALVSRLLRNADGLEYHIESAVRLEDALHMLREATFDIALIDYGLASRSGLDLIAFMGGAASPMPMILLTGQGRPGLDLAALEAGALDYLEKGTLTPALLDRSIRYAIRHHQSERRLIESERQMREALDQAHEASQAKSRFLAQISHELRTPLNAIIGFSDILRRELFEPLGPRSKGHADDIHRSGEHLLSLVNEILDLSRIECGKVETHLVAFDLGEELRDCLKMCRPVVGARGPSLTLQCPSSPGNISTDRRMLRQVIINVVSNALKFTPPEGQVTVAVERESRGGVNIEVRDNGQGIAADELEHVMQPFSRSARLSPDDTNGIGLGLSLARSLTQILGGRLDLNSKLGRGTTVSVHLP